MSVIAGTPLYRPLVLRRMRMRDALCPVLGLLLKFVAAAMERIYLASLLLRTARAQRQR